MRFAMPTKFKNIHQYFGIPETTYDGAVQTTLRIHLEPQEILGDYILVIHRMQKHLAELEGVPLACLPSDLERNIYKYLADSNTIKIHMRISHEFPIRPPQFAFMEATRQAHEIKNVVDQFKCSLAPEWSPSFGIEKSVLYLLSNILQELHYV
jgi:hypothetical protein